MELFWSKKKTANHKDDFDCLNCLNSFRTENKLKIHEKICKNKDFSEVEIPSEKNEILKLNQYIKSDKMSYIVYADLESLIKKIGRCTYNPEKSSTTKNGEHMPCGCSMSTIWGFDHIKDKHTLYRGKNYMKKFFESLREHAKSITDFEEKKNVTINKKRIKTTWRYKSMLYLQEILHKKTL